MLTDQAEELFLKLLDTSTIQRSKSSASPTSKKRKAGHNVPEMLKYSALKNVADICDKLGRPREALDRSLQALECDATDVLLWYHTGLRALRCRNTRLARFSFEQGLACSSQNVLCLSALKHVLAAIGDVVALQQLPLGRRCIDIPHVQSAIARAQLGEDTDTCVSAPFAPNKKRKSAEPEPLAAELEDMTWEGLFKALQEILDESRDDDDENDVCPASPPLQRKAHNGGIKESTAYSLCMYSEAVRFQHCSQGHICMQRAHMGMLFANRNALLLILIVQCPILHSLSPMFHLSFWSLLNE